MLPRLIVLALILPSIPAWAFDTSKLGQGGTLTLDEITPLINQSTQLRKEVADAAAKANKKAEDIVCDGVRFPGQWVHLGGGRVSPYACDFGEKWLKITATVRITSRSGRAYETASRDAMRNATTVRESNPKWEWTTQAPE
jgi:hypothetical protein